MSLFERKDFVMHTGGIAHFKIECDALTDEDLNTLAWIVSQKGKFSRVVGVPTGGIRFARVLNNYVSNEGPTLLVDDVLTTGQSMEEAKQKLGGDVVGIVIFARGKYSRWIKPIFEMNWITSLDD